MKKLKLILVLFVCALLFSSCKTSKGCGCLSMKSAVEFVLEKL